jgi:hypothetical protein
MEAVCPGPAGSSSARQAAGLALFSFSLFLSAMLMFAVQPMAGKMLLPLVGGTPAGWIVALAFFQVMLLAGYFYAHLLSRLPPLMHGGLYVAALALSCFWLPPAMQPIENDTIGPGGVFLLLAKSMALPFLALSATSSTLQRLFAATGHRLAGDPYFLYAASNLGSFTGLFLYPLVFERHWGLMLQARHWREGFVLLIACALLCLAAARGHSPAAAAESGEDGSASARERLTWGLLSFIPSALLLAVTTHISTDIFSAPLLWVVPLSLYLLTFVAAFAQRSLASPEKLARLQPVAVALALGFLFMFTEDLRMSWRSVAVQLVAFTATALMCHLRLAAARPRSGGGRRLTEFYLVIALGGALGGLLNAFVFPTLLNRLIEYPVLLCLSLFANPGFSARFRGRPALMANVSLFLALFLTATWAAYVLRGGWGFLSSTGFADVMLFATLLLFSPYARNLATGGMIVLLLAEFVLPQQLVLARRDFYGVLKVYDFPMQIGGKTFEARYLYHGTTAHGMQIRGKTYATTPVSYYARGGPVDDVFALYAPKDVAVLGLGAGTLNCFGTKATRFTFFEIDPAVIDIASDPKIFSYLSACTHTAPPQLIIGDGRLEIARQAGKFDLIVLDAFSSDTIPAHLLTTEAIGIYLQHLKPGGVLLFNLSNRYFDLGSALARNAETLKLDYLFRLYIPDGTLPYASPTKWFVMGRGPAKTGRLADRGWLTLPPPEGLRPWTDDDTDLLSVLELTRLQMAALREKAGLH